MKYIVILGDGMADEPIAELGNKTPLQSAKTPNLDRLSKESFIGMVHTIPDGMKPGSDTANLSVLGYDPSIYYSGRSPLEALSIGIPMKDSDIALRCNLVTISEEEDIFEEKSIIDHSSSEIETEDSKILLEAVAAQLETETFRFYTGTSYRHCVIWDQGQLLDLVQPHDVLTQKIGQHLPENKQFREMMKKSYDILVNHPINIKRKEQGLNPANCCWFWGAGTKPALTSFEEKTKKKGFIISAVDLLKGIAVGTSMGVAEVEGANGGLHTNYEGKVNAAFEGLTKEGYDFVYVHVEAPDEMGHQGSYERKIEAIEYLDTRVIGPLSEKLDQENIDYRMLVLPDHPTPVRIRTHTSENVPYLLFDSTKKKKETWNYNEIEAKNSGNMIKNGYELIDILLQKGDK